jgi:dipeptidyl aminopeptidase/acylaminoacyl peptidase
MRGAILAALLVTTGPVAAQDADLAAKVEAIARVNSASSPSMAPDGRRFVYLSNVSGSPQVWMRDMRSATAKQLTDLPDPVQGVEWSPKGDWIAYVVAPGGGLNAQIWVMKPDGTAAKRLTAGGKENNNLYGWTDDGAFIQAGTNRDFAAGMDAIMIDPVSGATTTIVGEKGLNYISDMHGERAIVGRLMGRGDSDAYLIDRKSGTETLLTKHEGKAEVDWGEFSRDGKTMYAIANIGRDRQAFGTIAIGEDGAPGLIRYFAQRDDAVAETAVLSEDGSTAALMWNVAGKSELAFLDTASGKVRPGPVLPLDIAYVDEFSPDGGTLVITGGAADRTTDIYLIDVDSGAVTRATQSKHDGVDMATLVRPELIAYEAPDGVKLSGWLYRPRDVADPMPVVFNYHGGPEGQARPGMSPDTQALVASGIAVFAPNVRGSSGFGKAFMALDDGAKRVGSVSDVKATTDALVAKGIGDPARLGIMGGSYGGYMVMAGITEYPEMFAAGVNLFGVVNFESFFRETEPWMAAISTTEYGDPATEAEMLKGLSPIHKLDRIKTPLFVLHGANDTNVPLVEAEQIVADLKSRGVPVKYTLFPDEGHGWRKMPNRVRSTTEIVGFFSEHLKRVAVASR